MRASVGSVLFLALASSSCAWTHDDAHVEPPAAEEPPPDAPAVGLEARSEGTLAALDWPARIALEQAIAATDPRHAPRIDEAGIALGPEGGSATATLTASGAHVRIGEREATLRVTRLGRGALVRDLAPVRPELGEADARFDRGLGVVEWWRSLPSGLEHGMTLATRPPGDGGLTIDVALDGALTVAPLSEDAVALVDASGATVGTYAHLFVLDAAGAPVPARMRVDGETIRIEVDDTGARYPLVVDPVLSLTAEATLTWGGASADANLGYAVAITADGTRAFAGAWRDDAAAADAGSVIVFLRTGTSWSMERLLTGPAAGANDRFGASVATSADGSRVIIGAVADDTPAGTDAGSAHVFLRTGTLWALEQSLTPTGAGAMDNFGFSVALSADGSRAIVGAMLDDTPGGLDAGSARVFSRTGSSWAEEAALTASGGAMGDRFGSAVAFSSDASRAIVGAFQDDVPGATDAGTARVFSRAGAVWSEEATLTAPSAAATDYFGFSVSLSGDGSRALVGAYRDDVGATPVVDAGSAHVFLRSGTSWALEATLTVAGGLANDWFGCSVSLTTDGAAAIVGAYGRDSGARSNYGSAIAYARTGVTWTQEVMFVDTLGGAIDDQLGFAVAFAGDGTRVALGAYLRDLGLANVGEVRVFTVAQTRATGADCSTDGQCVSGFCTDGVCCTARCGPSATDCQACSAALTGGSSGTCAALSAAAAPSVTCRASAGGCDVAETCTAGVLACPGDTLRISGTVCRTALSGCDAPETCSGASAACPVDAPPAMAGVTCRISAGTCDVAEVCDGTNYTCPGDAVLSNGSECRASAGGCDVVETCNGSSPVCPADGVRPAILVCRPSSGACDVPENCTGLSPSCPTDLFASSATVCGPAPVDACDAPDHCAGSSGSCVATLVTAGTTCRPTAGVCDVAEVCTGADVACPANAFSAATVQCRPGAGPCDVAESCSGASAACPSDAVASLTTTCRPSSDACDAPELCDGSTTACPANALVPAGVVCRSIGDVCDVAEVCTGLVASCPADAFASPGTTCRTPAGPCDVAETCSGAAAACPTNAVLALDTICRPTAGGCDPSESCDGVSVACPADGRSPNGTVCGGDVVGSCSTLGMCDGTLAECPGASPRPAGTVCMPADLSSECDVDDTCDGVSDACVAQFRPMATACGAASTDVCDAPDHCAGTSADCVETFLAGVECRSSSGACDSPELCLGDMPSCPPDLVQSPGISCRTSVDLACDPAEVCDGVASSCPADEITCSDAGVPVDGGAGVDAARADGSVADVGAAGNDAGAAPVATGGCACRAGAPSAGASWPASLLALAAWLATRARAGRRRARRQHER